MTGQCCVGGTASRRLPRRISAAAVAILPGALLVLLPKCPMCLAAWLTVATGIGFSAVDAEWMRGTIAAIWIAAIAIGMASFARRMLRREPADLSQMP